MEDAQRGPEAGEYAAEVELEGEPPKLDHTWTLKMQL